MFNFAAFILFFFLACCLLASPWLGRLFYPLHYEADIRDSAVKNGLDPLLIAAVIHTESGFRPGAVSSSGARGLMQVMPDTAAWIAREIGYDAFSPEMLFEPRCNIELGSWYLADLLKQFNGDLVIALAAYNGGRGRVNRWLEMGTWDGGEDCLEQIPYHETRTFVQRVLKTYRRYRQLYHVQEENHAFDYIN